MCVCVCARTCWRRMKEPNPVVSIPERILHGAKLIISSSAARVISSKQTTPLWTEQRTETCLVHLYLLSPLPRPSLCSCASLSACVGGGVHSSHHWEQVILLDFMSFMSILQLAACDQHLSGKTKKPDKVFINLSWILNLFKLPTYLLAITTCF